MEIDLLLQVNLVSQINGLCKSYCQNGQYNHCYHNLFTFLFICYPFVFLTVQRYENSTVCVNILAQTIQIGAFY